MQRAKDAWRWLTLWGAVAVTAAFPVLSLARQLDIPSKQAWTDSAAWSTPGIFILGVLAAVGGSLKLISLRAEASRSEKVRRAEGFCQQVTTTVHQSLKQLPIETLTVHAWRVKGDSLERLASFRVERRPDAGVVWTKGKGGVGQCWATNLQIEADMTNLHTAAAGPNGQAAFTAIPPEGRFYLTWDEYQKTKRYWSIFVTPLKDGKGNFIGCLSIDTTAGGHHSEFIEACNRADVTGLVSLMEQVLRER
jgi:hypothetical protein